MVGGGQEQFAKEEIVEKYHFTKVTAIVAGGAERYDSVWQGLKAIRDGKVEDTDGDGYVFIHTHSCPVEGCLMEGAHTHYCSGNGCHTCEAHTHASSSSGYGSYGAGGHHSGGGCHSHRGHH